MSAGVEAALADLRDWLSDRRSMNNYIVGTLGDPEAERRLVFESDNAQIVARAAVLNAEVALLAQWGEE